MRWYFYFSYDLHVLKEHMKQCVYHELFLITSSGNYFQTNINNINQSAR